MSFQLNLPPSLARKMAAKEKELETQEDEPKTNKREDWKKMKELEEARKAGTAPAMKDEEGNDINPHIPQYIMQAPWYYGSLAPTLKHQRIQEEQMKKMEKIPMDKWYKRGVKQGQVATKYRKGACENCGAITHKKKDCLERPRKVGAKFTGSEIAPDEHVQPDDLKFDFESKRDRWNGYDMEDHKKIFDEFAKMEEAKRQLKAAQLEKELEGEDKKQIQDPESSGEEDEDKYADDVDMPGQKFETKQRITVRNLRIREDTAKYLYNLDPNSAYYDPKTRSMRENPYKNTGNKEKELQFSGDNFVRWSGDASNFAHRQVFAWEAYEKGADINLQADPTKLEMLAKEYKKKQEKFKDSSKQSIVDKYGGEEHLDAPPKQLLLAQSEDYVEYSRHGTIIKGNEKAKIKSRFEEDVYPNNHKSVWGSYWKDGAWGYKCCHSTIKESYCTGEAGKNVSSEPVIPAIEDAPDRSNMKTPPGQASSEKRRTSSSSKGKKKKLTKRRKKKKPSSSSESSSSSSSSSDGSSGSSSSSSSSSSSESEDEEAKKEKKIQEFMKLQAGREKEVEQLMKMDERKRPYNSMYNVDEPTEEEMEAWRRKNRRTDDPMADLLFRN